MATYNGQYFEPTGERDEIAAWNPGFGQVDTLAGGPTGDSRRLTESAMFPVQASARVNTQPVDEFPKALAGNHSLQFGFLDWYNRIHFQQFYDLGNLISAATRQFEVFNAYFENRELGSVVGANDEGLLVTGPGAYPYTFGPLESGLWTLQADTDGPPVIDATFTFTFDSETLVLHVIGVRVIAWQFQPDWNNPVIERLEWLTDVMRSYSGREQRAALRTYPRVEYEFSFNTEGQEANLLESTLFNWHARVWALPIWTDASVLLADVVPGDFTVSCDTSGRDFHVGGLLILSSDDGRVYEAVEVEAVAAGTVTLKRPTTQAWTAGLTWAFPARTARLAERLSLTRMNARHFRGVATFRATEPIERTAAAETTYRSYPVMTSQPNWRDGIGYDYERVLDVLDTGIGVSVVDDGADLPVLGQSHLWTASGKDEIESLRRFLYARRGRFKALWVPTWANDLRPVEAFTVGATTFDVENIGAAQHLDADNQRQDIRIELKNGTVLYRRVTGVDEVSATVERLSVDVALGVVAQPEDVLRISWMSLMRLAQDSVELAWSNPSVVEAAVRLQGMRHDV